MNFQEEKFEDIWDEMYPLLEDHWHEVAVYQDKIELSVDKAFYESGQESGGVHLLTARTEDGELVGYTVTLINRHPHYKNHLYAVNDVIFMKPEYRGELHALDMVETLEDIMRDKDVSVMTFHMKNHKPFEKLMDATGFEPVEYLYSKYTKD